MESMILYFSIVVLLVWPLTCLLRKTILFCSTRKNPSNSAVSHLNQHDDNKKLANIWVEVKKQPFIFASIHVNAWDRDSTKITDIGVSIWSTDTFDESDIQSHYWRVKENMFLENERGLNDPNIFTFGRTKLIHQADIKSILHGVFESPMLGGQQFVIVGHEVEFALNLIEDYWVPPRSAVVLDTQKIWQLQNHNPDPIGLKEALDTTPGTIYDRQLLCNTGNNARFTLRLLQAQGRDVRCKRAL
ncbi:hypothetical protein F4811DRAFT_387480 [Daldinia bambusicola]|nr:hypothetical protein F4811DRAFT_387480 [Daldinia bambusicola]